MMSNMSFMSVMHSIAEPQAEHGSGVFLDSFKI